MIDFSHRSTRAEWMDDPTVSFDELRACLVDLARVNVLTLAYRPTLQFLDRLLPRGRALGRPIEIVDVGSGYGDLLRQIAKWARRRRVDVSLTGVDLNPWARRAAIEATEPELGIEWVTADVFSHHPPRGIDVVVSSLFTHHLSDVGVVAFLRWMEANARLGWFVNDLHRHPLPYHFFTWFAGFARLHHFVRHDGPVSIARAFVPEDWHGLLTAAGLGRDAAEVEWKFPFRLTVARCKERAA
jgi:SAM-dependent methyltransferase